MDLVCNYAIARFLPYRETGEFVNIGVVLCCPAARFFGFRLETLRARRVWNFFPELDAQVYREGLKSLKREMKRFSEGWDSSVFPELLTVPPIAKTHTEAQMRVFFRELVRTRETLFSFGPTATALITDPQVKLDEVFEHSIHRVFAMRREYQEVEMRQRLSDFLKRNHLNTFYKANRRVGNEDYHVVFPFVNYGADGAEQQPRKAIKPLNLAKATASEITQYGDEWISRVRRLRDIGHLPTQLLFPVQEPAQDIRPAVRHSSQDPRVIAARAVRHDLEKLGAQTIRFDDQERLLDFAVVPEAVPTDR